MATGTVGFAAVGALFAAMLTRAQSRAVLLPVLLYPALMLGFSGLAKSRVEELKEQTYPVMITVDGDAGTVRFIG